MPTDVSGNADSVAELAVYMMIGLSRNVEKMSQGLEKSDYVVLCLPLTPSSQGMIDEDTILKMKPVSFIAYIALEALK